MVGTEVVVLDVGGVILSWRADAPALDDQLEMQLGLPKGEVAARIWSSQELRDAECGRLSAQDFWSFASEALGAPSDVLAAFDEALWSETQHLEDRVVELLAQARQKRRVVAFTNAWSDARHQLNERYDFEALVDDLFVSAELGFAKPDAHAYELVLAELGVPPAKTAFIDDRAVNVEAAIAAGMFGIHCSGPDELIRSVKALDG